MNKSLVGVTVAAVLACGALGASVFADTQLSSAKSEITRLHQQVGTLQADNSSMSTKLSAAEQKLTANSTVGDVITCSDLKNLQNDLGITISGTDSAGGNLNGGAYISTPWLPNHCYKQ